MSKRAHKRRLADRLQDIMEAIADARVDVGALTREQFMVDGKTQRAVTNSFIVIGEAASAIVAMAPDLETTATELWVLLRAASDMRNALAHEYFRIDLEILWDSVTCDLPALERVLQTTVPDLMEADG